MPANLGSRTLNDGGYPARLWAELGQRAEEPSTFLRLIILERLVKSTVLLTLALSLLIGARRGWVDELTQTLQDQLNLSAGHGLISQALEKALSFLNYPHRSLLAVGALLYALLEGAEGVGLALRRRWAEYLTVLATSFFIPFEIYELIHKPSVFKLGALILNVVIVVWLARNKKLFVKV
ncbi:MAG: DUF2127 domain-containing protein [Candidatus Dormibacteraeota bacterium]|uniref:DUF2127 domain-containing protein n=1 Tax=Candidatus Dormiibacter inghamiae TaxID=3127013 RepID=A0A934ND82_9BACT|nr:DUF2127 domain-containing protein [Candidatus Dormibacteraeota bacterium]MBJ7605732.1 DUF2127 domain-containing protein [Candidatus Dormibacteraeota bacterium]